MVSLSLSTAVMVQRSRDSAKLLYIFADDSDDMKRAKRFINSIIRVRRQYAGKGLLA